MSDWEQYFDAKGNYSDELFWEEKVRWAEAGDRTPDGAHALRVGGNHFIAAPGIQPRQPMMGFGGLRIDWRDLTTGETFYSNNMWTQGDIPDKYRDRLPDNAEFLERVKICTDWFCTDSDHWVLRV